MERLTRMPFDLPHPGGHAARTYDPVLLAGVVTGLLREAASLYEDAFSHGRIMDDLAYARVRYLGNQAADLLTEWETETNGVSPVAIAAALDAMDRLADAWVCQSTPSCAVLDPCVFYAEVARIELALRPTD